MAGLATRRGIVTGLAALCLALCGCQFDPYTASYATIKPSTSEIVGTWSATDETLGAFARAGHQRAHPSLTISASGTIEIHDVPAMWRGADREALENFSGTWEFDKHQEAWWGLSVRRGEWECSGCLMILGKAAPYRLVIRYDDPDLGYGYEFKKTG